MSFSVIVLTDVVSDIQSQTIDTQIGFYQGVKIQYLPFKVKTQYLQIQNIVDTSNKRPISGQSTTVVKGCIYS